MKQAMVTREEADRIIADAWSRIPNARRWAEGSLPHLAETVVELYIAIHGDCGCPPPWDQCPHNEPLLPALNDARRTIERLQAALRAAGVSDGIVHQLTYASGAES